jgi:Zn-dependent peptidase ImmA (M78 family)/DNA-binding XRE family transcriptional regulator
MAHESRLQVARERAALTQAAVANALGVPREMVSYWETGDRQPSLARLKKLARLYRVNPGYLLGEEDLDERTGRDVLYRSLDARPDGHARVRLEIDGWLDFLDGWADFLENSGHGDLLSGARKPPKPLDEGYVDDVRRASRLAANVREHYDLGLDPLPDLGAFLDEIDVLVYRTSLGSSTWGFADNDGVSGAFFNHPRVGWSILVNTSVSTGRQTFTLAHEFAHALYHYEAGGVISREDDEARADPKERFANAFAAHFLVPGKRLRTLVDHYGGRDELAPPLAAKLASYFGVSYSMLLYRLLGERLITAEERKEFSRHSVQSMVQRLNISDEPFLAPKHATAGVDRFPFSVLEIVRREIEDGNLSPSQAANLLYMNEIDLQAAYFAEEDELTDFDRHEQAEYASLAQ